MNKTSIEWTHRPETGGAAGGFTWNPIRARFKGLAGEVYKSHVGTFCTRISPGCTNCYASVINKRFGNGLEYTVPNLAKVEFFIDEKILAEPLKRKKPATIFVGDMFDLFHEAIPDEVIYEVFGIAYGVHWHTLQFLTKRADRMHRFFATFCKARLAKIIHARHVKSKPEDADFVSPSDILHDIEWPLPNVWLGVSVEDNKRAIERVPRLQETPAAVRFLSVEPQLEQINFVVDSPELGSLSLLRGFNGADPAIPPIDWVICGGESGHGARPFHIAWAESLIEQCKDAGVPFFMKQIGNDPRFSCEQINQRLREGKFKKGYKRDRKGGDPSEWPEHLRVREFPAERLVAA